MPGKQAISVTLKSDNLTWLKGRAGAARESISEILDQVITAARASGRIGPVRSVAGTIDIDSSDPLLEHADAAERSMFEASLGRPLIVRERKARYRARAKESKPRA